MTLANRIRAKLRRHVPESLRRLVAQARRRARDAQARTKFEFATKQIEPRELADFICAVEIVQPIRQTAHYEGKMHNIGLAVGRLNRSCVPVGQALSFWQIIGAPTAKHGYQLGRGIVRGKLGSDIGGGLCQIASLLYELGLRAGATVLERHAHSRDLYTEDNRFTPLGLDAAIVWGFKDVRLANPYAHRVAFAFDVNGSTLRGRLFSERPIPTFELEISRRDELGAIRIAEVSARDRNGKMSPVSRDSYVIDPT